MSIKKLVFWLSIVTILLAFGSMIPAIAQKSLPTPVVIKGKPQPGLYELPERIESERDFLQQALPEQLNSLQNWHRLVFQSYRDGNWEIYGSDGFGWLQNRFTDSNNKVESYPKLSPDTNRIAFQANFRGNFDIYVMNWGGGGLFPVTVDETDDFSPAWSPDGQRLAFVANRDGNPEIYVTNWDGTSQVRLTNSSIGDYDPAWSPDGKQIAWVQYQNHYGTLWVMNADGSNPHSITDAWLFMGHPSWSSDGSQIGLDCDADGDGWNELVTLNANGTNWHIIQDHGSNVSTDVWMGNWSSNDEAIVYSKINYLIYGGELYLDSTYVMMIYVNGGSYYNLTETGYDLAPDWMSLDKLPPSSQVKYLPEYSRASGFWLYWSGYDRGISGLYSNGPYQVEYRLSANGTWTNLLDFETWTTSTSKQFYSNVIDMAYFRSRAVDDAGNWENWPEGNGDAWTKLYVWLMKGTVRDGRGYSVPKAAMTFSPLPWEQSVKSDPNGQYQIHSKQEGDHTIQASHIGYHASDSFTKTVWKDIDLDVFLPPQEDLIQHGNFEADDALSSWAPSGTLPVQLTEGYSGDHSAVLGKNCGGSPCLNYSEIADSIGSFTFPVMDIDSLGNVHVLWDRNKYSMKSTSGTWSSPVVLAPTIPAASYVEDNRSALVVDHTGTLHVVIVGESGLYYLQKTSGGSWSAPQAFAIGGRFPALALDADGTLYVSYFAYSNSGPGGVFLIKRLPGGGWDQALLIDETYNRALSDVAVDQNHKVMIVIRTPNYDTNIRTLLPNGTLTPVEKLIDGEQGDLIAYGAPEIIVDAQGKVHVLSDADYVRMYISRAPGETWSTPISFARYVSSVRMAVDSQGKVFVIGTTIGYPYQIRYFEKLPTQLEFNESAITTNFWTSVDSAIDIDGNDLAHMVWSVGQDLIYAFTEVSSQLDVSQISQVVHIPAIHQPTLSYMHALDHDASTFDISISDSQTNTVTITPITSASWSHGWIDMSPWAGKTVTVTFALHQAADEPYAHLYLDDISLGSWLTPVIQQVSPSQIDAGIEATLTITGENFIATPIVRLNDTTLANVQFVDPNTLYVTLPANLTAGIYTLWVVNPQGQEAALPGALRVGKQINLPLIMRE